MNSNKPLDLIDALEEQIMMNSHVQSRGTTLTNQNSTTRYLAAASILVATVIAVCGCSTQEGSVFKVQTGEKTLLDIKKNPDQKVSIEVDVPRVNLRMNQDQVDEQTTVTQPQPVLPLQPQPAPQPQY